jgi:hypothetical protein
MSSAIYYAGSNASTVIPVDCGSVYSPGINGAASTQANKDPLGYGRPRSNLSFAPSDTCKIIESEPSWNWGGVICSAVSMCCCVSLCGFFGLLCSIFAYADHRTGRFHLSRKKNLWSLSCAALGMAATLLGALAVVLIFVIFYDQLEEVLKSVGYSET